ncbi:unnamed protein product, partial [Cyprideis torosa]
MAPLRLGYWQMRGWANPIQFMLEVAEIPYEVKRYPCTLEGVEWKKDKFNLGLDFPNIPYIIDGDVRLTESLAIMRYIGRKANMVGTTEEEMQLADESCYRAVDLRDELARVLYYEWNESGKAKFLSAEARLGLPGFLKLFDKFLENKKYLAGEHITFADFHLYETLMWCEMLFPDSTDGYPNVTALRERIHNLPAMHRLRKSDSFLFLFYKSVVGANNDEGNKLLNIPGSVPVLEESDEAVNVTNVDVSIAIASDETIITIGLRHRNRAQTLLCDYGTGNSVSLWKEEGSQTEFLQSFQEAERALLRGDNVKLFMLPSDCFAFSNIIYGVIAQRIQLSTTEDVISALQEGKRLNFIAKYFECREPAGANATGGSRITGNDVLYGKGPKISQARDVVVKKKELENVKELACTVRNASEECAVNELQPHNHPPNPATVEVAVGIDKALEEASQGHDPP